MASIAGKARVACGSCPCRRPLRQSSIGWCNGLRNGSVARSSARGSLHATWRTRIWRFIRARRRRSTRCSGLRSRTGLRRVRARAQKVFTLQTLPAEPEVPRREVAESSGFSLHAGIAAKASQRDKLERLARYVARPPVANERLSLTEGGNVRCALKTPYRDGTTHVIFEPEDFIARLDALVLDGLERAPRTLLPDQFGLVEADNRLRECVVVGVADAPDG